MRSDFDVEAGPLKISLSKAFGLTATKICLDPLTRRMHVDRTALGFAKEPLDVAFSDISKIEVHSYYNETSTTHTIRLELQSGERYFLNGGTEKETTAAVEAIKSFLDLRPEDASNSDAARRTRRLDLVLTICGLLILAYPTLQGIWSQFVLPDCGDDKIKETLHDIVARKSGVPDFELLDLHALADGGKGRTCQATWSRGLEDVTVDYRIVWSGWTPRVEASWRR